MVPGSGPGGHRRSPGDQGGSPPQHDWLSLGSTFTIVGFNAKFLIEENQRLQSAFRAAVDGE